jgi:hypothetical protein
MKKITTDRWTDGLTNLYDLSGANYFYEDLRNLILEVINELYTAKCESIFRLRLNHIDRAIFKYRQAKEKRVIWNTKQYFKACLLSAINESGIDEPDCD